MNITVKTNGYKAENLQHLINIFNKCVLKQFGDCTINHFYYGDNLDMVDVILDNGHYAYYNLTKTRISMNGYTFSTEEAIKFEELTFNDELYPNGRLFQIYYRM